ncbi:ATP-grasp domain-containing protein [Helicobacter trogontum]|uniref:ATP-grasp domain-containing protein n=1 Tax=Helicobacter trogontum TaxID=50960 RepID=UPI000CF029E6|nr:alpha-L-glutamate ligase [Helicobacter trogontum]
MLYNTLQDGIYIIHENNEWIPPFKEAFDRAGVEFREIFLTQGGISLDSIPPNGVFWSRLSASSHTRDNAFSKEYGRAILSWLESHKRCVINGSDVLELEVSKVKQALLLESFFKSQGVDFKTPKTLAVFGKTDLINAASSFAKNLNHKPFITKHNQGGKGLGVRLFENVDEFRGYVESAEFELPIDGITLLQEYVESREAFITRCEFIGGKFHYAVRVDTSNGAFELCPADACQIDSSGDSKSADSKAESTKRPALAGAACEVGAGDKFSLRKEINSKSSIVQCLEQFLAQYNISVAGIEFIESVSGDLVVYDINTNTNYNSTLESKIRQSGGVAAADRLVEFLHEKFRAITQ